MATKADDIGPASIQALLWHLEDSLMVAAIRFELAKGDGLDLAEPAHDLSERVRQLAQAARDIRHQYNRRHGL